MASSANRPPLPPDVVFTCVTEPNKAYLDQAVAYMMGSVQRPDGSVSSFNIVLWLGILALLAAVLIGGYKLHAAGRTKLALGVLAIVALPGLAYVLFFGAIIVLQPRWN